MAAGGVPRPSPELQFRLLGPLEVRAAGEPVPIGGTRQRIVMAMLLLEAGQVVPTERLITAVWDGEPPTTARTQIQISISKIRAWLSGLGLADAIVTHESGYVIRVPPETVDLARFTRLVAGGRAAARRQQAADAAATLRAALDLWRGGAMAGIRSRLLQAVALRLDEDRLAVTEECIELEIRIGRHHEVIGELRGLVAAHPLRERLYGQLMLALYRDGRQAEALEVYRDARHILVEEFGLDPSESLRSLERAILDADPEMARPVAEPDQVVPRQLPAQVKDFVGRSNLVSDIRRILTAATDEVAVVSGPAGVGKTALALHAAYLVSGAFPDGQLFAHLRGSDSRPVPPAQVLDQFLRGLGVAPATLPTDPGVLASLYRSRLAGHRVLVFLDDAASARQVEQLLPAGPAAAVIVTSRGALPGLRSARRFDLEAFSPEASLLLLSGVLGAARVEAEPAAAAAIAESCGHLPLALQIAAAKLSIRRHWSIARMASRLGDESRRLDELSLDGAGVRASISVSYEALGAEARRLLPLLGALGGTDFASWVAGPLLDVDAYPGADVLDELVDARLVEVQAGTGHQARYRLHDLVGVFARELLAAYVPAGERAAAQHRLLRCWLFLACQAHRREYGGDFTVLHSPTPHWPLPAEVVDELVDEPIGWFESEHANLVAAVRLAAELDFPDLCWDLAVTSVTLFETRTYRTDWRETHEVALKLVGRHGDRRAEAALRCSRAGLALVEQRFADAQSDLTAALAWFTQAGDPHGRGLAMRSLGSIDRLQGRYGPAEQRYRQALTDLRAAGDEVGEVHVLINLAQVHADRARYGAAEELLRHALAICTRVGARRIMAQTRHRLGQLYLAQGEVERAETEFTAVLGSATVADDPVGKAYALLGLGAVGLGRQDLDRARVAFVTALEKMRRSGSRLGEGRALLALAQLCLAGEDLPGAASHLDEADQIFADLGAEGWLRQVGALRQRLAPPDFGSG
jgi:DNA-binding SARP family transcriptional activator/tetratricopeptide (TPR) repeat protein